MAELISWVGNFQTSPNVIGTNTLSLGFHLTLGALLSDPGYPREVCSGLLAALACVLVCGGWSLLQQWADSVCPAKDFKRERRRLSYSPPPSKTLFREL